MKLSFENDSEWVDMLMEPNVNHNSTGIVNSTYRTTLPRKKMVSIIILSDPPLTKRPRGVPGDCEISTTRFVY